MTKKQQVAARDAWLHVNYASQSLHRAAYWLQEEAGESSQELDALIVRCKKLRDEFAEKYAQKHVPLKHPVAESNF